VKRFKTGLGLLVSLCLLGACNNEQRLFYKLQEARREQARARPLADELSKTSEGIKLALADFNVFGGTTSGWSSWILMESGLTSEVEPELEKIVADPSIDLAKSVEAAHIMWVRTRQTAYLEKMFEMVSSPGDLATEWGRRKLTTSINSEEVSRKITVPPTEPIQLNLEEFRLLIRDPQNLRIPNHGS
jgi:hypothetical protein